MKNIDEIMLFNKSFVENKEFEKYESTKNPKKKILILSCMDTRLTELLPRAMNLKNGDAKIVKNAGATIMHPFGSVMRSILVAVYEFDVNDIIVVGHHECGMSNLDTNRIINKMIKRGIDEKTIATLNNSGIDVGNWLHGFESVEAAIRKSVSSIKNHPLMQENVNVHGLIMDPSTGALEFV